MTYYITGVTKVLQGGPLETKDKLSFNHPPIESQEDWDNFLNKVWEDVNIFAELIEDLTDDKLLEIFMEEKQGIYYRNLHGIVEHCHYHLGQVAVVKKILLAKTV